MWKQLRWKALGGVWASMAMGLCSFAHSASMEMDMAQMSKHTRDELHFGISAVSGFAAEQWVASHVPAWNSIVAGAAIGVVPGVLKEVIDHSRGASKSSSAHDLRTDLAGSVVGALVGCMVREKLGWSMFVAPQARGGLVVGMLIPLRM